MRVLHVIPSVAAVRGGPSEAVLEIAKALRTRGIEAEIAATNDNGESLLDVPLAGCTEYKGARVRFFPRFSPPVHFIREYAFSWEFTRWLWKNINSYDMIHVHAIFSYTTTAAMVISRMKKVPYIVRPNGMLCEWSLKQGALRKNIYLSLIERANINGSRLIEFTSTQEKKEAMRLKFKPDSFTLPYGLHMPACVPEAPRRLREFLKIPGNDPVILFMSRLHRKKGLELLIPALGKIKARRFVFVIAGTGSTAYEAKIDGLLLSAGIRGRSHRVGFVEGEKKKLLLQGADIFVLPSYSESFGLAVLEAMACRLPVIITDLVGIYDDVKRQNAGIVTGCDTTEIADAITELLDNEDLIKTKGENGQKLAREKFNWDKIAEVLAAVYNGQLNIK